MNECIEEIKTFQKGGVGGLGRLKEILPTLYEHYHLWTHGEQAEALRRAGIQPTLIESKVSFVIKEDQ